MFSKKPEDLNPGLAAGAVLAGGVDLVKELQSGEVTFRNVDFVVATPEILADLAPIRGLFKLQYPNSRQGNYWLHSKIILSKIKCLAFRYNK